MNSDTCWEISPKVTNFWIRSFFVSEFFFHEPIWTKDFLGVSIDTIHERERWICPFFETAKVLKSEEEAKKIDGFKEQRTRQSMVFTCGSLDLVRGCTSFYFLKKNAELLTQRKSHISRKIG